MVIQSDERERIIRGSIGSPPTGRSFQLSPLPLYFHIGFSHTPDHDCSLVTVNPQSLSSTMESSQRSKDGQPSQQPASPMQPSQEINSSQHPRKPPTVLSDMAYSGPKDGHSTPSKIPTVAGHSQAQISIDDVLNGFQELGKTMAAPDMLTMLLRALAQNEAEYLFEYVWYDSIHKSPLEDLRSNW
jgi:hypothetical protein